VVGLPTGGDPCTRIERISAIVRAARGRLTGPSLVVLLGPVFQAIAGLRLYRTYLNHQRRFHTLVSNVKGPKAKVSIGGVPVRELVGVSVAESGNVTVNFLALSYAGRSPSPSSPSRIWSLTSKNSRRCCRPNWTP